MKIILLILISLLMAASCSSLSCSSTNASCTFGAINNSSDLGNSAYVKRNYDAAIISDLSPDPILIENITAEVIDRESNRPLSLPTNLLQYSPSSYKIGVGDKLFIYIYGETERLSASLAAGAAINPIFEKYVRDDGTIFYPNAGILKVENKTVEEIRSLLTERLSLVLNNPQVDVSISEFNSQKVTVSGFFGNPGIYPITTVPMSLSQVMATANGFSSDGNGTSADLTNLKFTRDGYIYNIDYEFLSRNSQIQNLIYLKDGDVLHLADSANQLVHVLGEASSSTSINITRKKLSLSSAIAQAGGLNRTTAKTKDIYIFRPSDFEGKPRIFKANLSNPNGYLLASNFNLESQDIVYIGTKGVTSWSRFIAQLLPFTSFLNSAQSTEIVKNKGL